MKTNDTNDDGSTFTASFLARYRSLNTAPCYRFAGDFESMTFLDGRWKIQRKWTAAYALSINTVCFGLLQCTPMELPVALQLQLVTFYHASLPESFDGFVEPSRNSMARYCLNSVSEIRKAARMLLTSIIQRMSQDMKIQLIKKWKSRFCGGTGGNYCNSTVENNGTPTGSAPRQPPKQYRDMLATGRNRKTTRSSPRTKTSGPSLPYLYLNDSGGGVDSGVKRPGTSHQESINSSGKVPLSVLLAVNAQEAKNGATRYGLALHNPNSGKYGNNGSNSNNNNSNNNNGFNPQESGFVEIGDIVASSAMDSADMIDMSLACDYIQAWFVFVNDIESLLKTLLDLKNCDDSLLSLSPSNTLLQAGCAMPQSSVEMMGNEVLLIIYHNTPQQTLIRIPCSALVPTIGDMSRASAGMTDSSHSCSPKNYSRHKRRDDKYYQYLYKHLPLTASTIICCLEILLQATTASLDVLGALSLDNKGNHQVKVVLLEVLYHQEIIQNWSKMNIHMLEMYE